MQEMTQHTVNGNGVPTIIIQESQLKQICVLNEKLKIEQTCGLFKEIFVSKIQPVLKVCMNLFDTSKSCFEIPLHTCDTTLYCFNVLLFMGFKLTFQYF